MSEHRLGWARRAIRRGRAKLAFLSAARPSQDFWVAHELAAAGEASSFLGTGRKDSPRSPWFSQWRNFPGSKWREESTQPPRNAQAWCHLQAPGPGQAAVGVLTSNFLVGNMSFTIRRWWRPLPSTSGHLISQNSGPTENQLRFALWELLAQEKNDKTLSGREELRLRTSDQTSLEKEKESFHGTVKVTFITCTVPHSP